MILNMFASTATSPNSTSATSSLSHSMSAQHHPRHHHNSENDPIAAAVAAAAEIARNGGAFLYSGPGSILPQGNSQGISPSSHSSSNNPSSSPSTSNNCFVLPYQYKYNNEMGLTRGTVASVSAPSAPSPAQVSSCTPSSDDDDDHHLSHSRQRVGMARPSTTNNSIPASTSSVRHSHQSQHYDYDDDEDDDEACSGMNAEKRIARSRERNREHARRTRLRKKAQLEALQSKVKGLQAESKVLQQSLEECSIASILVGLSDTSSSSKTSTNVVAPDEGTIQHVLQVATSQTQDDQFVQHIVAGKRKRFANPNSTSANSVEDDNSVSSHPGTQTLHLEIDGKMTVFGGGRTQINWKTGVYTDDHGKQRQLTHEQLESLRRERNRMHAKMTRDRKKNFIATIEKTIEDLETNNRRMKEVLAQVVHTHFPHSVQNNSNTKQAIKATPSPPQGASGLLMMMNNNGNHTPVSPETRSVKAPSSDNISPFPSAKRVRHGFV